MFEARDANGNVIEIASVVVDDVHYQVAHVVDDADPLAALLADSQLTVSGTAIALADEMPADTETALISVRGNTILWWDDGKTPTATEGHELEPGNYFYVKNPDTFEMIAKTGSATVVASYYRPRSTS